MVCNRICNQKLVSTCPFGLTQIADFSSTTAESVVQASIVIITTAAGKLQDDTPSNSLDNAVTLWLIYAFICVAISGWLLFASKFMPTFLPAARLAQVPPRQLPKEVARLAEIMGVHREKIPEDENAEEEVAAVEKLLKSPVPGREGIRWWFLAGSVGMVFVGWIMFGMGVNWGVHGSVVAGTVGE